MIKLLSERFVSTLISNMNEVIEMHFDDGTHRVSSCCYHKKETRNEAIIG